MCACWISGLTLAAGSPMRDGEYPLAIWKELIVEEPWNMFDMNDALRTDTAADASVFSLASLSSIALNTTLFFSTLQFLWDDLAGLPFNFTPWPLRNLSKNGWQNSGSALNVRGGP